MTEYSVRKIEINELKAIFKRIKEDFSPDEYAPYDVLKYQIQRGIQEGLILQRAGRDVAYAICAGGHENGYVLISLLAVYREVRKNGVGTAFIEEIKAKYRNKKGLIVEIEKPEEGEDDGERRIRLKRKEFYERAGFYQIPDIDYSIWDVPMHLMVFSRQVPAADINRHIGRIMHDIYLQLMGERYIHKLSFNTMRV